MEEPGGGLVGETEMQRLGTLLVLVTQADWAKTETGINNNATNQPDCFERNKTCPVMVFFSQKRRKAFAFGKVEWSDFFSEFIVPNREASRP